MSKNGIADILSDLMSKYGLTNEIKEMTAEEWGQAKVKAYNDSIGNLHEADGQNCDICKNKGYIARIDENGYEVYKECKCMHIRRTLIRAKKSGLGNILSDYTFDKFICTEEWQKENKDKAMAFCKDTSAKWFFIGGAVGSGKTHLCTAIAGHYIKAGDNVKYMLWSEDSKKLKAAIVNGTEYGEMINEYKQVDVLYIDDFLKTKAGDDPTAGDINIAFEILNRRLIDGDKITVISSEKTLQDLLSVDEATMSRIYEQTGDYKINMQKDIKKNYRLRG